MYITSIITVNDAIGHLIKGETLLSQLSVIITSYNNYNSLIKSNNITINITPINYKQNIFEGKYYINDNDEYSFQLNNIILSFNKLHSLQGLYIDRFHTNEDDNLIKNCNNDDKTRNNNCPTFLLSPHITLDIYADINNNNKMFLIGKVIDAIPVKTIENYNKNTYNKSSKLFIIIMSLIVFIGLFFILNINNKI